MLVLALSWLANGNPIRSVPDTSWSLGPSHPVDLGTLHRQFHLTMPELDIPRRDEQDQRVQRHWAQLSMAQSEKGSSDLDEELLISTGRRIDLADSPDLVVLIVVDIQSFLKKLVEVLLLTSLRSTGSGEFACRRFSGVAVAPLLCTRHLSLPYNRSSSRDSPKNRITDGLTTHIPGLPNLEEPRAW